MTSILLTGCINPNGMKCTAVQDATVRRQQYIDAITFYLSNTKNHIVFVENSNEDISDFFREAVASKRLECFTFDGNNYDKSRGKGYGEALIIIKAFTFSEVLRNSHEVIKITGRVIVRNINRIIAQNRGGGGKQQDPFIMVDFWGMKFIPTIVFSFSPYHFIKYLESHYEDINETKGCIFEHVFYRYAKCPDIEIHIYVPSPQLDGICGGWGCAYENRPFLKALEVNLRGLKILYKERHETIKAVLFRILYIITHLTCFRNKKIYNKFICGE